MVVIRLAKDKYKDEDLVNYYTKVYEEIDNASSSDPYGTYILSRVKGGQKTVLNKTQSEIRNFDMSFLDMIESVYPAITKIMRDPKKSIRYEQEVVAVEKAKKVNSDTVRHLSSHTQLIKEITKEGDVIPSKVQTTFAEEELAIYENRFIKSLVRRIEMFLERRYEVMKVSLESFETERLNVQNEFLMSGQKVSVSLDIQIKNDLTVNVETTKEQYNRLLYIRDLVQSLKGTDFMRALAKARDVVPPIMKTNILMHNPDFKLCYGLWLYLDRVDGISTNIDVSERTLKYSNAFDKDINACMALAVTSFIKNRNIEDIHASKKLPQQKAPKPIRNDNLELELNLEADNKKLEDYTMNEILLSQTAKFFEASFEGMKETGNTYNESIRVVYRQMLDMLDQIYPKAFGVADDELDSKSYYEQLEYARRRMMIFKIVRQAKQMNIARMAKEEKRIEKLITKLEDKIKLQEQKERERLERERIRDEQERINKLEREKALQEKKRKLEKEAIEKQKKLDKEALLNEEAMLEKNQERDRKNAILKPFIDERISSMKALREREMKKPVNTTELPIPIRRIDEYDDLSNTELEALMAENDLLEETPAAKEEPKEEKTAPKKKKAPQKKKKAPIKSIEDKSIEEMTDEELEVLLNANQLDGIDSIINDSSFDNIEDAIKEEEPVDSIDNLDDLSDEELEALMNSNSLEDIDKLDENKPLNSAASNAKITKGSKKTKALKEEAKKDEGISDSELSKILSESNPHDFDNLDDSKPEKTEAQKATIKRSKPKTDRIIKKPEDNKEASNEEPKEEFNEVSNEEPKNESKENLKEEPKTPISNLDDLSDEELDNLMNMNADDNDSDINPFVASDSDQASSNDESATNLDDVLLDDSLEVDSSASSNDLDDLSDEELEALMNANGLFDGDNN